MESEIEKLRKEREEEIKRNNEAALSQQEDNASKAATTIFAIIGFLKSCNNYTDAFGHPNGVTEATNSSYFGIFLFLNLVIYPVIGAIIGWVLIKIIFAVIRSSK